MKKSLCMNRNIAILLAALLFLSMASVYGMSSLASSAETETETEDSTLEETDFTETEGIWLLDGENEASYIYMDGLGNFIACFADDTAVSIGYLEYVDEYEGGSGRYDMYNFSGDLLNAFYVDSDTQIHTGNDSGTVYIRTDDVEDVWPEAGVLIRIGNFTGLTSIDNIEGYYGGFYYSDLTEDGMTLIVNCSFLNDIGEEESLEEYIARCVELVSDTQVRELDIQKSEEHSKRLTYPAYVLNWLTGENEDTRNWDALIALTDTYTCVYAFNTAADYADEMYDTWMSVFEELTLIFVSDLEAETETTTTSTSTGTTSSDSGDTGD